jgi:hypothetical protein
VSDGLARAVSALRDGLKSPGPEFTERVMAEVRRMPAPRRSRLAWATEPRVVRVRPWFVPLAAAALLAMWVLGSRYGSSRAAGADVAAVAARDTVYVRFEFSAPAARAVNVAGDFNGWKPDATQLSRGTGGVWVATIPIVVGVHKYQFVVDGDTWVPDPAAGTTDDGFGGRNSLIVVGPKGVVRS